MIESGSAKPKVFTCPPTGAERGEIFIEKTEARELFGDSLSSFLIWKALLAVCDWLF